MTDDLGTRKSLFIVVVIVGCFAVLWPKVLHPMIIGPSPNHHRLKPNNLDQGCCDVISDIDINTIKIMNDLCNTIIQQSDTKLFRGQNIVKYCQTEIFDKCGIDISAVLQEQIRLGRPFKRIVDELRSYNGSSCLKYKFGISPWSLGIPHKVTINLSPIKLRQERPLQVKPDMIHPALREKGSAIPQSYPAQKSPNVKYVEGRPGPIPGMRPPMGGGSHIVPPQKGLNSMGIIMPLYTIGIVIFFSYTLMKVLFRRKPEGAGAPLYPPVDPSPIFRKEVFESQRSKISNGTASSKLGDEEMDHLKQRLRDTELIMERIVAQMTQVPLRSQKQQHQTSLANGSAKQTSDQPSVKILGMETIASCEGGQKWGRSESPVIPNSPPHPPEITEPPQEIYLAGALPAQSQLLVADAVTEPEIASSTTEDPAVVLASKMTLSVISVDKPTDGRFAQHNGDLHSQDSEEALEESKYTTASCATAAESDVSEEEQTDDELENELDNVPECVVDNGTCDIHTIDHYDDEEVEVEDEEEEEEEVDDEEEEEEEEAEDEEIEKEPEMSTTNEPKAENSIAQGQYLDNYDNSSTLINNNIDDTQVNPNSIELNQIFGRIEALSDIVDGIFDSGMLDNYNTRPPK